MSKDKKPDWSEDAAYQKWKTGVGKEFQHLENYTKDELIEVVLRTIWHATNMSTLNNRAARFMQTAIPLERTLTELKADLKYAGVVSRERKRKEQVDSIRPAAAAGKKDQEREKERRLEKWLIEFTKNHPTAKIRDIAFERADIANRKGNFSVDYSYETLLKKIPLVLKNRKS